ncbi:hypothetical protein NP493_1395g00019 [Ridgeia piscesae]|uniref:EGF-like domain-containing protein n=1 Tax=Ridgeia piscesae TaxID=27915 RepID=A0AAD9K5F8_RIDPI|nr:hypothetical protein NP493_1395g00019 [Ridgeia piscesae]
MVKYVSRQCVLEALIPDPKLCADVVCVNGGSCRDTQSGYKCHCMADYTGEKCEVKGQHTQLCIPVVKPFDIAVLVATFLLPPVLGAASLLPPVLGAASLLPPVLGALPISHLS